MRRSLGLACIIAFLATACAPRADMETAKTSLLEADRAWAQSTTDLEQLMSRVAPNASMSAPNMAVVQGADAIRQFFTATMAMPGFSLTWEPSRAEVGASGDFGYTAGSYHMTMADSTGAMVTEIGKYVTVWERKDGGDWNVLEDIFNADPAPAAPAAP